MAISFDDVPEAIRSRSRRDPRLIPIRLETFEGETKWRAVPSLDHGVLCRAFALDEATFWFEGTDSLKSTGRSRVGYGGNDGVRRDVDGYLWRGPSDGRSPHGKWEAFIRDGQRFRDRDPLSRSDFERLGDH